MLLKINLFLMLFCSSGAFAAELSMLWLADNDLLASEQHKVLAVDVNGSTLQVLRQGLPDLAVQTLVVNTPRAMALLKSEANACAGNKILSPDRLQHAIASQLPQVVFPGFRLFALRGSATAALLEQLKNAQGKVSVQQLLEQNKTARFAIVGGRNYSKSLDALMRDPRYQRRFWQRHASDLAGGVIQMLQSGRVELLIEYPNVVQHNLLHQPKQKAELFSLPLAESPEVLLGHILCANTDVGRQLLALLNRQLALASQTEAYLQAHLQWFEPSSHAEVTQLYNQVYGTRF